MSVFSPIRKAEESKVHNSQYLRTGDTPDESGAKPEDPAKPEQPKAE